MIRYNYDPYRFLGYLNVRPNRPAPKAEALRYQLDLTSLTRNLQEHHKLEKARSEAYDQGAQDMHASDVKIVAEQLAPYAMQQYAISKERGDAAIAQLNLSNEEIAALKTELDRVKALPAAAVQTHADFANKFNRTLSPTRIVFETDKGVRYTVPTQRELPDMIMRTPVLRETFKQVNQIPTDAEAEKQLTKLVKKGRAYEELNYLLGPDIDVFTQTRAEAQKEIADNRYDWTDALIGPPRARGPKQLRTLEGWTPPLPPTPKKLKKPDGFSAAQWKRMTTDQQLAAIAAAQKNP